MNGQARAFRTLIALSVLMLASVAAQAQGRSCIEGELVGRLLKEEARRIGGEVATLKDSGEVARYIKVINEEPPAAGPAETLMILVHPKLMAARVFLVHLGIVCERYLIGPELHRKAWTAARGVST